MLNILATSSTSLTKIAQSAGFSLGSLLWYVFGIVLIVYLIVTGVLLFHWKNYGMKSMHIFFAKMIYLLGSLVILGIAFFAVTMIHTM